VSRRWIRKDIFENFHFRGHLPQNLKSKAGLTGTHSEQATGHRMHCREILFIPLCSPSAREFPRSGQLFVRCTVAELLGVKVAQFWDFGLFSRTKRVKITFRWSAYSQGITSQNDFHFQCGSRRFKGVPSGSGVFLRLLVGGMGMPNLPKFSPMANGYTHTEWYYMARQIWTNDVWKRAILRTDVGPTFPPNVIAPTPKNHPKPHFGGPFNAKPIIEIPLRKSHVNGATKLKLYSYIGIGNYLGVCQNFSARGRPVGGGRKAF